MPDPMMFERPCGCTVVAGAFCPHYGPHGTKPRSKRLYDPRCYDLASAFLADGTEEQRDELAAKIQWAIEDWFADRVGDQPQERADDH